MTAHDALACERFPRTAMYNPDWILSAVSGGANSLWLAEWLTEGMDLRPGMRVLDLGCGMAASSIFLHREFGVQVWATDLWFSPVQNLQRIRDAGVADGVFALHADARSLPFGEEFFDAIVGIDSFHYFGTDDNYLHYLARFAKPGGQIGIASAGLVREIDGPPDHLRQWWDQDQPWCFHTANWWRRHWERTGILDMQLADVMPDGWQYWIDWLKMVAPANEVEINALEADRGSTLGYVRAVGRRTQMKLFEHFVSLPTNYARQPLLRSRQHA